MLRLRLGGGSPGGARVRSIPTLRARDSGKIVSSVAQSRQPSKSAIQENRKPGWIRSGDADRSPRRAKGSDPSWATEDREKSRNVHASENAIRIGNALDWAVFRVLARGPDHIIEGIRVSSCRDDTSAVRAPGDPLSPMLGQLCQGECNPILEVFSHVHELLPWRTRD